MPPVVADKQLPNEGYGLRGFLRETNEVTGFDRWSPAYFDKYKKIKSVKLRVDYLLENTERLRTGN